MFQANGAPCTCLLFLPKTRKHFTFDDSTSVTYSLTNKSKTCVQLKEAGNLVDNFGFIGWVHSTIGWAPEIASCDLRFRGLFRGDAWFGALVRMGS